MEWFRWYHGACSDAKWPIIARKAKVSVGVVVSVWAALLEYASQDEERGSVAGFDGETYDALYGYEDGTCDAVLAAMIEKSLICDGCICAWSRRQAVREREDATNAERQRRYRERKKQENADENIETSADVTPRTVTGVTRNAVTPSNASVTPPEQRREEQRKEENIPPFQGDRDMQTMRARVGAVGEEKGAAGLAAPAASGGTGETGDPAGTEVPLSGPFGLSRPGPTRTDAPGKSTPEWTAFLSCWDVYPVRQGQEEAWREWMRLKRNGTLEAAFVIREAILRLSAEDSRWLRGKVPKFARWLNGKGWRDEPFVEPGDADAVRGGRNGPALPGVGRDGRGKEPAAPTEYQRQRQSSRRMAAALLAGRQEDGMAGMGTGTGTGTGGVYETTAFATAGGTLPALRTGSLA